MYTIKLYDGTVLENLTLNGNNFISNTIIPDSVFENNLKLIEISDGETTQTLTDQFLAANRVIDNKSWFVLIDKTPEMKRIERGLNGSNKIKRSSIYTRFEIPK
jgi:hypothetical protein